VQAFFRSASPSVGALGVSIFLLLNPFSVAENLNHQPIMAANAEAVLASEVSSLPMAAPVLITPVVKPPIAPAVSKMSKEMRKLALKYDVTKIGERDVAKGMNFYSVDREIAMGREIAEQAEQELRLVNDPVVTEYVNRVGQNLVRNSDAKVPFTIKVVDSGEINAFALPGGFFYVNTGLILAADNEAELAGVMAHEIAHVAARHATHNMSRRDLFNMLSVPAVFVGGPIGVAVREATEMAMPLSYMKFSRDAEREADLLGMEYSYATGYDPAAVVSLFEKLAAQEKKKKGFLARAFDSHPMTSERVRRAQEEMETMLPPKVDYVVTTSEFDAVKARLQALVSKHLIEDVPDSKPTLRKSVSSEDTAPAEKSGDDRPTLKRSSGK
jgi:beta-barrel assembly-enhancing protease